MLRSTPVVIPRLQLAAPASAALAPRRRASRSSSATRASGSSSWYVVELVSISVSASTAGYAGSSSVSACSTPNTCSAVIAAVRGVFECRPQEARLFAERLRVMSDAPVVYVERLGAQHTFEMVDSIRASHTVSAVDAFLAWLLSRDVTIPG